MKIGTDMSLKVCSEEGYTVMDFKVRELFPNGRKEPMDKDCVVILYSNIPEYLRGDFATKYNPFGAGRMSECFTDFNTCVEVYLEHKEDIDSFAGICFELENPDECDFLNLADTLLSYGVLEWDNLV